MKEGDKTKEKEKDGTICYTAASVKIIRNLLHVLIGISVFNTVAIGLQIALSLLK